MKYIFMILLFCSICSGWQKPYDFSDNKLNLTLEEIEQILKPATGNRYGLTKFAEHNEFNHDKAVRSDDPRLKAFTQGSIRAENISVNANGNYVQDSLTSAFTILLNVASSTSSLSNSIISIQNSTGTDYACRVSTGLMQIQLNQIKLDTTSINTNSINRDILIGQNTGQMNTNLQNQIYQIGRDTGSIRTDLTTLYISTGTLLNTDILIGQATGQLRTDLNNLAISTTGMVTSQNGVIYTSSLTASGNLTVNGETRSQKIFFSTLSTVGLYWGTGTEQVSTILRGGSVSDGYSSLSLNASVINLNGAVTISGSGNNGINPLVPVGSITMYSSTTPPTGYLYCNGQSCSTTTFSALFAVTGYIYGGSGANFNVPDCRGMFIRGFDQGRGEDSEVRVIGSTQTDTMQGHKHASVRRATTFTAGGTSDGDDITSTVDDTLTYSRVGTAITDGTNGTPRVSAETRSKNIALPFIIKY